MLGRVFIVVAVAVLAGGCGRLRFSIDLVPADDGLTETEVLAAPGASAKVALIDVTGLLVNAPRRLPFPGENPVARFAEALQRAGEDAKVKAVLIRINSPGGAVTACEVMYRELEAFKREHAKPVVMLMGDVAASGGYYLACAGDEVMAHPTTITGSIGVVIQTFNFAEGMRKVGVKADAITSGPNKAMGSPFEPMSPEHRALLQGLVDEFYESFLAVVVTARPGVAAEDLDWIADGRVVTGRRAHQAGLVDRLGGLREAFERAKHLAGVGRARLVKYHRPLEYVGSAYATAAALPTATEINLVQLNVDPSAGELPGFYYLWVP